MVMTIYQHKPFTITTMNETIYLYVDKLSEPMMTRRCSDSNQAEKLAYQITLGMKELQRKEMISLSVWELIRIKIESVWASLRVKTANH